MKRSFQLGLFLCAAVALCVSAMQAAPLSSAKAVPAAAQPPVLVSDALVAVFETIDQKSKTVVAMPRDPDVFPAELPPDLIAIRERMLQRLPKVDSVRQLGQAGESNRGFLDLRGSQLREVQAVVADENTDRLDAYRMIAEMTKTDVNAVGRARAKAIAGGARRSVWVQAEDGTWYQKI